MLLPLTALPRFLITRSANHLVTQVPCPPFNRLQSIRTLFYNATAQVGVGLAIAPTRCVGEESPSPAGQGAP